MQRAHHVPLAVTALKVRHRALALDSALQGPFQQLALGQHRPVPLVQRDLFSFPCPVLHLAPFALLAVTASLVVRRRWDRDPALRDLSLPQVVERLPLAPPVPPESIVFSDAQAPLAMGPALLVLTQS